MPKLFYIALLLLGLNSHAQLGSISIEVKDDSTLMAIPFAKYQLKGTAHQGACNLDGTAKINAVQPGSYWLQIVSFSYLSDNVLIEVKSDSTIELVIKMHKEGKELEKIVLKEKKKQLDYKLKTIDEGLTLTHGKKTEQIKVDDVDANTATNNGRQVYNKIAGLNIWESDGAGIQLGIGGRGLNPSRTSNFNTRQNGYDISADALGYPESYYTPIIDAVDRIQVIRGAASLQFGTQFGGLLNFIMKKGRDKPFGLTYRQSKGSFGLDKLYLSVDGTVKDVQYYVYGTVKNGEDWRPNSSFDVYAGGANVIKKIGDKGSFKIELTKMSYLTQQPGGLTDVQFNLDPSVSFRERNWFKVDWNLAALEFDYKIKKDLQLNSRLFGLMANRSALGFLGQINRVDPNNERTLIYGDYLNWGNETRLLKQYEVKGRTWAAVFGARYYNGYSESRQGNASNGNDANFTFVSDEIDGSSYEFPSKNYAVFAEHLFQLTDKFGVTPGVRFEHIDTKASGSYRSQVLDLAGNIVFDSLYNDQRRNRRNLVIAGVGVNYQLGERHRTYANFSQNYRSINFTDMQIQNPNFKIDPDLQDETGFNVDWGFQGSADDFLYYDVSLFSLFYNNRIGTTIEVDSVWYTTYQYRTNIAASLTNGVEAMLEFDWSKYFAKDSLENETPWTVRTFANVSLVSAKYLASETSAFNDKDVELVPPINAKLGMRLGYKDFSLYYQFSYTHEHFSDATNSLSQANAVNGLIPSYYISDFGVKYKYRSLQFETGVNNLFDHKYFTRRASGYPGPGILPSSPRNYYLTLQLKF